MPKGNSTFLMDSRWIIEGTSSSWIAVICACNTSCRPKTPTSSCSEEAETVAALPEGEA